MFIHDSVFFMFFWWLTERKGANTGRNIYEWKHILYFYLKTAKLYKLFYPIPRGDLANVQQKISRYLIKCRTYYVCTICEYIWCSCASRQWLAPLSRLLATTAITQQPQRELPASSVYEIFRLNPVENTPRQFISGTKNTNCILLLNCSLLAAGEIHLSWCSRVDPSQSNMLTTAIQKPL